MLSKPGVQFVFQIIIHKMERFKNGWKILKTKKINGYIYIFETSLKR